MSSPLRPVVSCWSNQLGTWMRADRFPGGLHSSDIYKEMDIDTCAFMKLEAAAVRDDTPKGHRDFHFLHKIVLYED